MTFEIRKGVPLPAMAGRNAKPNLFPFAQMEIGDSILIPIKDYTSATVYSHRQRATKELGYRFATRKVKENDVTYTGVWRVEPKPSDPVA